MDLKLQIQIYTENKMMSAVNGKVTFNKITMSNLQLTKLNSKVLFKTWYILKTMK